MLDPWLVDWLICFHFIFMSPFSVIARHYNEKSFQEFHNSRSTAV